MPENKTFTISSELFFYRPPVSQEVPSGAAHFNKFKKLLQDGIPFTFVRFSDGEVEVIRNRKLTIFGSVTEFRGRKFANNFPVFDSKRFDPALHQKFRSDLIQAAVYKDEYYFKGIRTYNSVDPESVIDREFLLRLHGGFDEWITFCDLLANENYEQTLNLLIPTLVAATKNLYVIGNFRAHLGGCLAGANLLAVPDNLIEGYAELKESLMNQLVNIDSGSTIISSASSLSNIIGCELRSLRPDLTFIDAGSVVNRLIGLPESTRAYHKLKTNSLVNFLRRHRLTYGKNRLTW